MIEVAEVAEESQITASDMALAKDMADALFAHYPGHLWGVTVESKQGMAYIRNLALSAKYGYKLRLVTNYSASEFRERVILAGGEILERYRLDRGRADLDQIAALPVTRTGIVLGDLSR